MALFPFFVDIEGAPGLIVGGGRHAKEKIERLLPYGSRLRVIAEDVCPEIEKTASEGAVELCLRKFREADLDSMPSFVVVAGEEEEENHRIAELCRKRRILVNVVDDPKYCDFVFPSLIAQGNLSIGICTGGASPSMGVLLKKKILQQIPEHMDEILDFLQEKRPVIARAFEDKKKRFACYYQLSELCMEQERSLTENEFTLFLKEQV